MTPTAPVLDTDVLIDYLRGHAAARTALDALLGEGHGVMASVVTKAEIVAGMRSGEEAATEALLSSLDWVPVTEQVATVASGLSRHYRNSHPGVGLADYMIAATVELLGAELWTQNPRHFPMLEGLEPPYRR